METADDRRREEGSAGSGPVSGPPREIQRALGDYSIPYLLAWVLGILGILVAAAGAVLFVIPVTLIGLVLLAGAVYFYLMGRQTTT